MKIMNPNVKVYIKVAAENMHFFYFHKILDV